MDVEKLPFAEFLEGTISRLAKSEPEMIVIAAKLPGGSVLTGRANANAMEQAECAIHLFCEAMMDMVVNNIGMIRDALDDLEEDEDG